MDTASDASSSELYNHSCTTIVHKYTVHCCLPASFTKAETRYDWVKEERMNAQFYRLYVPMLDRIQQVWRKNFRFLGSTIRQFSKEEFSYYVHIVSQHNIVAQNIHIK